MFVEVKGCPFVKEGECSRGCGGWSRGKTTHKLTEAVNNGDPIELSELCGPLELRVKQAQDELIRPIEYQLRSKFIGDIRVVDREKGYLSMPWVNEVIDPKYQFLAAKMIIHLLGRLPNYPRVTKVAGVPTMGVYLAVPVAQVLGVPLAVTRKGKHVPERMEHAMVVDKDMKQYSNGVPATHIYNGLASGDNVLFVDDVLGEGTTILPIVRYMLDSGIKPYVGVYAAKLYRPGYMALQEMGVPVVYAYGIEGITNNDDVVLSSPQIN